MKIYHRGHVLSQQQLNAIVPELNELMGGEIGQAELECRIDAALEQAGCPIDTGSVSSQEV